jgi:hypothetical protein
MESIEIKIPTDEKDNNDSDHLASGKKNELKSRRCMDFELHDHLDDNISNKDSNGEVHRGSRSKEEVARKIESNRVRDFDSDADTFADADSDCEPNQFFLDEMLEDSHPERLNLLDYRRERQEMKKGGASSTLSSSHTQNEENGLLNDGDDDEQEFDDSSTSRHDEINEDSSGRDKGTDVECESTTDHSDGVDSFGNLPTISKNGKGQQMGLGNIGTSAGVGPGRPLLRQASHKAVWGK